MDELLDPLGDRVMKNVPMMARFPLKKEQLWHSSGKYIFNFNFINIKEFILFKFNDRKKNNYIYYI